MAESPSAQFAVPEGASLVNLDSWKRLMSGVRFLPSADEFEFTRRLPALYPRPMIFGLPMEVSAPLHLLPLISELLLMTPILPYISSTGNR